MNYQSKALLPLRVAVLSSALAVTCFSGRADLVNRYTFNDGTPNDSVGTANGAVQGSASISGGQLQLPGGPNGTAYLELPDGIIPTNGSITVEMWITVNTNQHGQFARAFDFGAPVGKSIFLSPNAYGNNMTWNIKSSGKPDAIFTPGNGGTAIFMDNNQHHLVWTFSASNSTMTMFKDGINGYQIKTFPTYWSQTDPAYKTGYDDTALNYNKSNWIGRAKSANSDLAATYNEIRIYNSALDPVQIAASYLSGSETPSTDTSLLGPLQAIRMTIPTSNMLQGDTDNLIAKADFLNMTNISLVGVVDVVYASDDTNVLTVDPFGKLTAVGGGTANLSATYQGKSTSTQVSVQPFLAGIPPRTAGFVYVDLSITNVDTGSSWQNRAGTGDFMPVGAPLYVSDVEGTGLPGVQLNGTSMAYIGPNSSSNSVSLEGRTTRSVEVWALNPATGGEETLVAWGRRGGPSGTDFAFLYGQGSAGAVTTWGYDMGWSPLPVAGNWHYLVVTYDGTTLRTYADGRLQENTVRTVALNTLGGFPIQIGVQRNNDGSDILFGQAFSGYLGMVRAHTGVLSAADIRNNYQSGMLLPPAPPVLWMSRSGTDIVFSWWANSSSEKFGLQSSPQLGSGAAWAPTGPTPVLNDNGLYTVTIQPSQNSEFYRLAAP